MSDNPGSFPLSLKSVLTAVSSRERWRMLDELMKEDNLTTTEIGRRVGMPASNASKHMVQLLRAGIVTRGYGNVYRIVPAFRVPNEHALDLGCVVVRLDALKHKTGK